LAPIPVLAIASRLRPGAAFLLGAIAWLIGETNQWNYVRHAIELPLQITILYFVAPAVVFGLSVLFVRCFLRRGSLFLASIAFPVYWVTYEYLTATASPHSTWGNLAYTQMDCLPVIQIAAVGNLGNQLRRISVCGRRGSSVERRGRTTATSTTRHYCRVRCLRSACFWQMAVAI
jgi:apolipoprotein N-acyltransferase